LKIQYAEVILPLYLRQTYTYILPDSLSEKASIGMRVLVSFGKNKIYTGIIADIHTQKPDYPSIKEVEELLDEVPIVSATHIKLWKWLSSYYMTSIGEIMDLALPNAFKLSSERFFVPRHQANINDFDLTGDTLMLADAIQSMGKFSLNDIKSFFDKKSGISELNALIQCGLVEPIEEIGEKYTAIYEKYIQISQTFLQDKEKLNEIFGQLMTRSKKQYQILLQYFSLSPKGEAISKALLMEKSDANSTNIKPLIDKGIFIETERQKDRFQLEKISDLKEVVLSSSQTVAYNAIQAEFEKHNTVLFQGITGSGKTEVYIQWIKKCLQQEGTILFVLPEIALTSQMVKRLQKYFGNSMVIYHSQINQNTKYEIWQKVYRSEVQFVVGTRSALFLPYSKLQAIIIDEEHDASLKQVDTNPRYNARDGFLYLAYIMGAKTLLGSATPSIESYFNAINNRYGWVKLLERYGDATLPKIELVDIKLREKEKAMKSDYSNDLIEAIEQKIELGEQTVLFQNRRGYAPYIQCDQCDHIEKCDQCDVRLTYHNTSNQMICHYCYKKYKLKLQCSVCKSNTLKTRGLGTQKVEEEISLFFPEARVARLDIDISRSKQRLENLLEDFKEGKIQILVGTQIVTKGFDFEKLNLIGVIHADNLFSFTDYKTQERAFQTLMQICGRAGRRKDADSKVILQTYNPKDILFQYLLAQDWEAFIAQELAVRKQFIYPPFCSLVKIIIRHQKEDLLQIYSTKIVAKLKEAFKSIVLGPSVPQISRIRNQYIKEVLIKLPKNNELAFNKLKIQEILDREILLLSNKNFRIDIIVDF
jgi:primosomal protein N' (replication factor Y)